MTVALHIVPVTKMDVELAWATFRALVVAEVDDPSLLDDETHQEALRLAKHRFQRLYDEWSRR